MINTRAYEYPYLFKWLIQYDDKDVGYFMKESMRNLINDPAFLKKFKNDECMQKEFMKNMLCENWNPAEAWMNLIRKECELKCIESRNVERKLRQECGVYVSEDYAPINLNFKKWNVEGWRI